MKNITLLSTILFFAFSLNATAQASATEEEALDAISEVSDVVSTSRWEKGLVYKIQILASKDPLQEEDFRLKNLGNVYSYEHEGLTKYTWGRTRLPHEAARLQGEMHRNGFKDAFVVHYYNGKRITAEEAKALRK